VKAVALDTDRTRLVPVTSEDLDDLATIRSTPEVARWWQAATRDDVEEEWTRAQDDGEAWWTAWLDDRRVGFIQAYEEDDSDYRHAGIDLYLAPAVHGQGLGREITARVAHFLIDEVGHHRVVIDPTVGNDAAVRCYEAVGFRTVGVMREYWYDHVEGRWADGLLMDLLARDLAPSADAEARR
jgi:aminoglycoside 6'-N-acetyltransferase